MTLAIFSAWGILSVRFSQFGSGCLELRNYFTSLFQENPRGHCPRCAQDLPPSGVPKWKADPFGIDAFRRPRQILSRGRKRKNKYLSAIKSPGKTRKEAFSAP